MSTGRVHFQLDLQSQELKSLEVPVKVYDPNLVVVTRSFSSQSVELPVGRYFVTTKLPGGQNLSVSDFVEVLAGQDTLAVLTVEDDDEPLDYWQAMGYARGDLVRTSKNLSNRAKISAKLRAFTGDLLCGHVKEVHISNWELIECTHEDVVDFYIPGRVKAQIAQLLQPEKQPLNVMLPAWGNIGCHLILTRLEDEISVEIQLENVDADMLSRYRQQGGLSEAIVKVTSKALSAQKLLEGKEKDPIAAAVVAYTLLRFGELERLHDWSEKLMNNFPSFPDGIVVRSKHLALLGEHQEAFSVLLNLPTRGMPLFHEGLSYAIDLLRYYLSIGEKHFDKVALSHAQSQVVRLERLAMFMDFYNPLFAYTGLDPNNPDAEPLPEEISAYQGVNIFEYQASLLNRPIYLDAESSQRADKPPTSSSMSSYSNLFRAFIVRSTQHLVERVQKAGHSLPIEDQKLVFYTLNYAMKYPETWPVTRKLLVTAAPKINAHQTEWMVYLENGIKECQQQQDLLTEADLHFYLGILYEHQEKFEEARREFEFSALQHQKIGNAPHQARTLNRLAYVACRQRRFEEAKKLVKISASLSSEAIEEQAYSYLVRGSIALDQRESQNAASFFSKSLALWKKTNDKRRIAWGLTNLGAVLCMFKRYEEAITYYEEAIELFEEVQDPVYQAVARMKLGNVYKLLGDFSKSMILYSLSEDIFYHTQAWQRLAKVNLNKGIAYQKWEKWEQAKNAYLSSIELWGQVGRVSSLVKAMMALGELYLEQGLNQEAKETFENAQKELTQLEDQASYEKLSTVISRYLDMLEQRESSDEELFTLIMRHLDMLEQRQSSNEELFASIMRYLEAPEQDEANYDYFLTTVPLIF